MPKTDLRAGMQKVYGSMAVLLLNQQDLGPSRWWAVNLNNAHKFYAVGGWSGTVSATPEDIKKYRLVEIRDAFFNAGLAPDPRHCNTCTCLGPGTSRMGTSRMWDN